MNRRFKEEDGVKNARGVCYIRLDDANALLEKWEKESQKIFGLYDLYSKRFKIWTVKGPTKLNREDYSHFACVWNVLPLEKFKAKAPK